MFEKMKLTEYSFLDGTNVLGCIKADINVINNNKFAPNFSSDETISEIYDIGNVNYAYLDEFIIKSLNDYYKKASNEKSNADNSMMVTYSRLYQMWVNINNAKKISSSTISSLYDDIVYELYVLGYKN